MTKSYINITIYIYYLKLETFLRPLRQQIVDDNSAHWSNIGNEDRSVTRRSIDTDGNPQISPPATRPTAPNPLRPPHWLWHSTPYSYNGRNNRFAVEYRLPTGCIDNPFRGHRTNLRTRDLRSYWDIGWVRYMAGQSVTDHPSQM